jgi:hypothetical protein
MKRVIGFFLAVFLTGCKEDPSSAVKEKENTNNQTYELVTTSMSKDNFDKKSMEEIRYIVELTDKIAEANQHFLNTLKNFAIISTVYIASKEDSGKDMSFGFTPKTFGSMSIKSTFQVNEDFVIR